MRLEPLIIIIINEARSSLSSLLFYFYYAQRLQIKYRIYYVITTSLTSSFHICKSDKQNT